jgi:hypothetical protein
MPTYMSAQPGMETYTCAIIEDFNLQRTPRLTSLYLQRTPKTSIGLHESYGSGNDT